MDLLRHGERSIGLQPTKAHKFQHELETPDDGNAVLFTRLSECLVVGHA